MGYSKAEATCWTANEAVGSAAEISKVYIENVEHHTFN